MYYVLDNLLPSVSITLYFFLLFFSFLFSSIFLKLFFFRCRTFPRQTLFLKIFIFTLFYFTIPYWFCHTLTLIHHGCTCAPKHEPASHLPPHNISLGHPRAHAVSCVRHRLAIRFLHDSIHVSYNAILPNHPTSPSPSESKSPLYTSVSFLLSCIQGHHCHLSKFHIYVLV